MTSKQSFKPLKPAASRIEHLNGDATQPQNLGPDEKVIIVQSVNNTPYFGAGVIMAIEKRYPVGNAAYVQWAHGNLGTHGARETGPFLLGETQLVPVADNVFIANICGQDNQGYTKTKVPVNYGALYKGLMAVCAWAEELHATVSLPRIGSGIGGGDPAQIQWMIDAIFGPTTVRVQLYEYTPPAAPKATASWSASSAIPSGASQKPSGKAKQVHTHPLHKITAEGPGAAKFEMLWRASGTVVPIKPLKECGLNESQAAAVKTACKTGDIGEAITELEGHFETVTKTDPTDAETLRWEAEQR